MEQGEDLGEQIIQNENSFDEVKSNNRKCRVLIGLIILSIILIILIIIILIKYKDERQNEKQNEDNKNTNSTHLYIEPSSKVHNFTIIFMPGLSNTPEDFKNLLTQRISISKRNITKIIILRSTKQNVSVYGGEKNYSWFDIYNFPMNSSTSYNFEDLKNSSKILRNIIEEEANLLNKQYNKIIIGGHSQGAIISLYTAYNVEYMLGGVISFCGFLPPQESVLPGKENLTVYYCFGDRDDVITPSFYNETCKNIEKYKGFKKYIYPNQSHPICDDEIKDSGNFLDTIMI